jgi:hypothetical protein
VAAESLKTLAVSAKLGHLLLKRILRRAMASRYLAAREAVKSIALEYSPHHTPPSPRPSPSKRERGSFCSLSPAEGERAAVRAETLASSGEARAEMIRGPLLH